MGYIKVVESSASSPDIFCSSLRIVTLQISLAHSMPPVPPGSVASMSDRHSPRSRCTKLFDDTEGEASSVLRLYASRSPRLIRTRSNKIGRASRRERAKESEVDV